MLVPSGDSIVYSTPTDTLSSETGEGLERGCTRCSNNVTITKLFSIDRTNATARENFDLKASRSDTEDGKPSREMSCELTKVAKISNSSIMDNETKQRRKQIQYSLINLYIIGQLMKYHYTNSTRKRRVGITSAQPRTCTTCKYPVLTPVLNTVGILVGAGDGSEATLLGDKSTNVGTLTEVMALNTVCKSGRISWFVKAASMLAKL